MKKLRILLWSALIALFCAAGVSADAAVPFGYGGAGAITIILLVIVLSILLSAIGIAIWILVRAGRKK